MRAPFSFGLSRNERLALARSVRWRERYRAAFT